MTKLITVSDIRKVKYYSDKLIPRDFTKIETLFCDSTGQGQESERALTELQMLKRTRQLMDRHKNIYAALTGIGQFQVYLTFYKKEYLND